MQALYVEKHGPHAELKATERPLAPLAPDTVRVEIHAAAVNPSDVMSAEGKFAYAVLPRTLGRDFAGRVVDGPPELLGRDVWGTGGDLGIQRDGTHAEFLTVPRDAVAVRPANITVEQAGATGVPFVTAWTSLVDVGRLQAGEWVLIGGAAGAVGSAATEVAAARGARVIALVQHAEEAARLEGRKVAAIARSDRNELAQVVREATGGRGADLALNGVGGVLFQPLMDALTDGGRMAVFSVAAGREVTLDLLTLYRRRIQLLGINTAVIDAVQGARILGALTPLFESGALQPLPILERYPLSEAARAYARVAQGAPGKIVLIPDRHFTR
jgi:NADPH2:quinone reductase